MQKTNSDLPNRANIIETVQTPLGFFTLVVLVVEVLLGITANFSQGLDRTYIIIGMLALIALLVFIVAGFAYFRPEALRGIRPPSESVSDKAQKEPSGNPSSYPYEDNPHYTDPRIENFLSKRFRGRFTMVPIPEVVPPKHFGVAHAPIGLFMVDEVPFLLKPAFSENNALLGHHVIDIQPSLDNIERVVEIPVRSGSTIKVYCLLSAGYGWAEREGVQFVNKRIGFIELVFDDKTTQRADLILGKNIREWAFGNSPELVNRVDSNLTHTAWISYDNHYRIDITSIAVGENNKRAENLTRIRIVAKFEEYLEKRIMTPSIRISAITCVNAV